VALNGCTGRSANTSAVRGCPVVSAMVPVLLSLTQSRPLCRTLIGVSPHSVFINDIQGSTSAVISPRCARGSETTLQDRRSRSRAYTGLAAVVFILRPATSRTAPKFLLAIRCRASLPSSCHVCPPGGGSLHCIGEDGKVTFRLDDHQVQVEGHEDAFAPPRLCPRCRFSQGAYDRTQSNRRDTP
jgi:hypothetical protein